jgi:hypothetical protein
MTRELLGNSKKDSQLKMRLGLKKKAGFKKPAVESHPITISGTLSDVLQESRSTQSVLDVLNSNNAAEGVSQISWSCLQCSYIAEEG